MSYFVPRFHFPSFASFTNLLPSFFPPSFFFSFSYSFQQFFPFSLSLCFIFLSLFLFIFLSVLKMMTLMKSCLERCFKKRTSVASDTFFFCSFSLSPSSFFTLVFSCFKHSIYFFILEHFSRVLSLSFTLSLFLSS